MSLSPIDLSTMYYQMENVSKYGASQTQQAQLNGQKEIASFSQQEIIKSKKVKELEKQSDSQKVGDSLHGSSKNSDEENLKKENQEKSDENKELKTKYEIKDPRLGQRVDIIVE